MISAIVLVKADPTRIPQCATKLAGIEGVSRVYSTSGEWDLVALVEVPDIESIARVVTEDVASAPGVQKTQTLTAFRVYSKGDLEQAWDIGVD
jgi:DNA-binding Lrp family transcriptional regulator